MQSINTNNLLSMSMKSGGQATLHAPTRKSEGQLAPCPRGSAVYACGLKPMFETWYSLTLRKIIRVSMHRF